MPSALHEAIAALFRDRVSLATDLLEEALHVELPRFDDVRLVPSELGEVAPSEFRADVVLVLYDGGTPRLALAIEVQLAPDPRKRFTWPVYEATLRARYACPAAVMVVTVSERVAAWCREPIVLGPAGCTMRPLVLGPRAIPVVADEAAGGRSPELALLSALAHATAEEATAQATALGALSAARALDDERLEVYVDLVLSRLPEAVRAAMEKLMQSGKYEFQSEYMKRWHAQLEQSRAKALAEGRAEGRAEGQAQGQAQGRAEGRAEALLTLLEARGVSVSDGARERIAGCTDLALLDRWLVRAATASSAEDVLGD